jgi:hypothetical protein
MTDTSRRTLLRASALGVILAPLVPAWIAPADAATNLYTRSRFMRLRKKRFTLVDSTGRWRVTLVKVSGDDRCFNLTFRSTTAGPPQGTYTLKRPGFAATTLFVVPSPQRRTYQAVINRAR